MRIIADEKVPFIQEYFGSLGELVLKPGRGLSREDVLSANMLILRSVTPINRHLLENTPVKFVGCVSTGKDHIDTQWLEKMGIRWAVAEGSNATGVVQYVAATIAALQKRNILTKSALRAAVIGVGRIGKQVASLLQLLGFNVLLCDPLRAAAEKDFVSTPLEELEDLDFITIHTPLTREGTFPTFHMIEKSFIQRQKKNCVILNAARGSVVDFSYLKEYGEQLYWCLDVFEDEPNIDVEVVELAEIATPHIAGYTLQSKYRGIEMIYRAVCEFQKTRREDLTKLTPPRETLSFAKKKVDWRDVVLKVFDPSASREIMQDKLIENGNGSTFDFLRNHFPDRHEFGFITVKDAVIDTESQNLLQVLGFHLET